MNGTLLIILVLVIFRFGLIMMMWSLSRGRQILEQWAQAKGYRIVSSEYRWLRRGPFFWTSSKHQMVYYIVVERGFKVSRQINNNKLSTLQATEPCGSGRYSAFM